MEQHKKTIRVLLIGEYSRLHNSLKEGLLAMGHQVTLLGDGDAFKKYPVDIDSTPGRFGTSHPVAVFFRKLWFYVFKTDPIQWEYGRQFFRMKKHLKGFDVVQLINENAIKTTPRLEKKAICFLRKNNKKLFLLSCGEDYYSVSHMLAHH
ncbi:MAG: glycosyltransferase family 1 protein, partial [Bacteroidota bacterium]